MVSPGPFLSLALFFFLLCPGDAGESAELTARDDGRAAADLHSLIDSLVSADRLERERGARRFREAVDSEAAEELVRLLPGADLARRKAVMDALGAGGPWMPGVLRAAGQGGAAGTAAGSILRAALAARPLNDDPPPLLGGLPIFGKSVDLSFPGTWPRAVFLDELLDWINFLAGPTHPLVLSPDLGGGAARSLAVHRSPVSGPAPMAIDLLLMERGLGVIFLQTVTLVTPGGQSSDDLSAHGQEYDRMLLDRIIAVLSAAPDGPCRRAALQALAWLDPPGFFEGYLEDLRTGGRGDCLDYLLTAGASVRLAVRLGLDKDRQTAAHLLSLWDGEPDGTRRRALARLLLLCPAGILSGAFEEVAGASDGARMLFCTAGVGEDFLAAFRRAIEEGGDEEMRAALQACARLLPVSNDLRAAFLAGTRGLGPVRRPAAALVDRCLAAMGPWLEDETLAGLVEAARPLDPIPAGSLRETGSGPDLTAALSLKGVLEAAARFGGRRCLDAVMERLRSDGAEKLQAVLALRRMAGRLDVDILQLAESDGAGLPADCGDALVLAFSRDTARRGEAAQRIFEGIAVGEEAVALVSFAGAAEIAEHAKVLLGCAEAGETGFPPGLRAALIRSPLIARDALAANMIRLELSGLLAEGLDPILDRALWTIASSDQLGAYTVEIRLF